jgi:hypothetical protein
VRVSCTEPTHFGKESGELNGDSPIEKTIRKARQDERLENWRGLPGAARLFQRLGYVEQEFFFEGAADELDIDGQTFGGTAERK